MLVVRHTVVGPLRSNAYLVACSETGEAILIDPGAQVPLILEMREPEGFEVGRIVFTHGHIDHVAGGADARRALGAPIQMHPRDAHWLESLGAQAMMFGLERPESPVEIDAPHQDGDVFPVGQYEARIIHTPGHTSGSCSVFFAEPRVLFTGDTLFVGGIGRTDLVDGDFASIERSIVARLYTLGDDVRFYPGHGPSGLIGQERNNNPFVGKRAARGQFV